MLCDGCGVATKENVLVFRKHILKNSSIMRHRVTSLLSNGLGEKNPCGINKKNRA